MIRVLVVDDDFMVARIHRRMVERIPGFTVVGEAHNGAHALSQVAEHRPDLVLLDIYLPDISGIEVLRQLRDTGDPEVDVLVVTAAKDAATVRKALHGGAVHYVIKPFDAETLRERLTRYQEMRTVLEDSEAPGQADIDRVFGAAAGQAVQPGPGPRGPSMPKGLTPESARLVRGELSRAGEVSSTECAELTGLSRVSARRYLEFFVEAGSAEVRLRYGTAGRPERRYRWTGGRPE
ncbi:two-component system CitB family response regulator [Lipingzhangella halophila]|uniref:Transcriptional regulatory protein n=1 Tax=Lipingzhangella halophila TaxID=1783352 RepID=A0A7W7RLT0_9ACTN|nr:response regulator [Lipingzhangella halophila]MBB4933821.1 two-component system CitB family response regulator [Lipingzhangella halophila]